VNKHFQVIYKTLSKSILLQKFLMLINKNSINQFLQPKCAFPFIYAMDYSLSKYLADIEITSVSIYLEYSERKWANQLFSDLVSKPDIVIKQTICNKDYVVNFDFANFSPPLRFSAEGIMKLNETDVVLILAKKNNRDKLLSKVKSSKAQCIFINEIIPTVIHYGSKIKHLTEIQKAYPYLSIVLCSQPHFPKNKVGYTSEEKYIVDNNISVFNAEAESFDLGQLLKAYPLFEKDGYTLDDVKEMLNPKRTVIIGKYGKCIDYTSETVNISNGTRVTPNQPAESKNTIYLHGGCNCFGTGNSDNTTSSYYLQESLNLNQDSYRVENYGAYQCYRDKYFFETIKAIDYNPGDILVSFLSSNTLPITLKSLPKGITLCNIYDLFERPHSFGNLIFFDNGHFTKRGQEVMAEKLYEFLAEHNFFEEMKNIVAPADSQKQFFSDEISAELTAHKNQLRAHNRIGAIVMNCNPFTLGHRYLIEHAAVQVRHLYIFAVEEDKSFFPFEDRLRLIQEGTSDLPNVTVLPSGKFIISALTFDDYFGKESKQENQTIDTSMDVTIFAKEIAPTLGITVRFAGEEPLDNVTRQYNESMARILPQHNIDFEVIPRKEADGEVISASRVRKLLEIQDFEGIAKIVPKTTLKFLVDNFAQHSTAQHSTAQHSTA
jgi:[citrate (pro-3S)-lyase] ligase